MTSASAAALGCTLALLAGAVAAQGVTGRVLDQATAQPVGRGFVVLLNAQGDEVERVLTPADGRFTLRARTPGAYRLRSERIAYEAFTSDPITLEAGQVAAIDLPVRALGVDLAAIQVTGRTTCRAQPELTPAATAVWGEALKALSGAAWTVGQPGYRYRVTRFKRELDSRRRDVGRQVVDTHIGRWQPPFVSRPAAELALNGYVLSDKDSVQYFSPDATVIQDSAFIATHCFALVRGDAGDERRIGLSFEPVPERRMADVKGVLWLDVRTGELRTLEFTYTRVPEPSVPGQASGSLEFLRLPTGAWIVRRWVIRMPELELIHSQDAMGFPSRIVNTRGFWDKGGEILEVLATDGTVVFP